MAGHPQVNQPVLLGRGHPAHLKRVPIEGEPPAEEWPGRAPRRSGALGIARSAARAVIRAGRARHALTTRSKVRLDDTSHRLPPGPSMLQMRRGTETQDHPPAVRPAVRSMPGLILLSVWHSPSLRPKRHLNELTARAGGRDQRPGTRDWPADRAVAPGSRCQSFGNAERCARARVKPRPRSVPPCVRGSASDRGEDRGAWARDPALFTAAGCILPCMRSIGRAERAEPASSPPTLPLGACRIARGPVIHCRAPHPAHPHPATSPPGRRGSGSSPGKSRSRNGHRAGPATAPEASASRTEMESVRAYQ